MGSLAGTGVLVRLALRRDRVLLPLWIVGFVAMAAFSASATIPLYPTLASRVQAAEALNNTTSLVALYGRIYDPTSVGALALIKLGGFGSVFVALFAIVTVVRHTRAEEEAGRLELVGATVVGRCAALTAALVVFCGAGLVLALATAAGLVVAGLPVDGSFAFGFAWAGVGVAFAAIAGVSVQIARSARGATGVAAAVLGGVYLLRAIGDTAGPSGPRWVTWLSPIGWGQQFRPYAGNRWWVLLVTAGFALVVAAVAFVLAGRRDLGGGLLGDRPGPPAGSPRLASPVALAWRLQRGSLFGWVAAFALLGVVFGNLASSVGDYLDSPQAREMLLLLGGEKGIVDAFLAAEMSIIGVMAAAYGIQAAGHLRSEETRRRAEPVLATATSRTRWAGSHTAVAIGGTALLMLVAGLSAGLGHGLRTGSVAEAGRVLGAALVQVPAAWVLAALVVAVFGWVPRLVAAGWGALVAFLLLGEIGPLLRIDEWLMRISPFAHVPRLPGAALDPVPLLALTGAAAVLVAAGLVGFRRRDLA